MMVVSSFDLSEPLSKRSRCVAVDEDDTTAALQTYSCRLQQSLVPQTRGTRGGEPMERHVGSYLSAFCRLLEDDLV